MRIDLLQIFFHSIEILTTIDTNFRTLLLGLLLLNMVNKTTKPTTVLKWLVHIHCFHSLAYCVTAFVQKAVYCPCAHSKIMVRVKYR